MSCDCKSVIEIPLRGGKVLVKCKTCGKQEVKK